MKCPFCIELKKRSKVYPHGGFRTAMSSHEFYDEDGVLHEHDRNKNTLGYNCSEGHWWRVTLVRPCPAYRCDFIGSEDIEKIDPPGMTGKPSETNRMVNDS